MITSRTMIGAMVHGITLFDNDNLIRSLEAITMLLGQLVLINR
jgi:hypothetical protein